MQSNAIGSVASALRDEIGLTKQTAESFPRHPEPADLTAVRAREEVLQELNVMLDRLNIDFEQASYESTYWTTRRDELAVTIDRIQQSRDVLDFHAAAKTQPDIYQGHPEHRI